MEFNGEMKCPCCGKTLAFEFTVDYAKKPWWILELKEVKD